MSVSLQALIERYKTCDVHSIEVEKPEYSEIYLERIGENGFDFHPDFKVALKKGIETARWVLKHPGYKKPDTRTLAFEQVELLDDLLLSLEYSALQDELRGKAIAQGYAPQPRHPRRDLETVFQAWDLTHLCAELIVGLHHSQIERQKLAETLALLHFFTVCLDQEQ